MSNPNQSREQSMRSAPKRRLRVVFEIDLPKKDFDRRKFNADVVRFFAEADTKLKGQTVLLTVEERVMK